MPHISPQKLDKKKLQTIYTTLIKIVNQASEKSKLRLFLNEFLTHTEKTMLAKRLAIILMLDQNTPTMQISEILNMSPATVTRLSAKFELGKYNQILEILHKKTNVFDELEKIVMPSFLPPMTGQKRWRQIHRKN